MIPKIIHLVWFGGQRPSFFDYSVEQIKKINSDYEVKEWNEDNIDFEMINKKLFDATENYGSKSDIFRFEILNKYGGIYMDYDFIQLKKFDNLLSNNFFVSAGNNNEVWNSIVGSTKNHPICIDFLNNLQDSMPVVHQGNYIQDTMHRTGPYYLAKIFAKFKYLNDVCFLPKDVFFSFDCVNRHLIKKLDNETVNFIKSYATENTIAIHFHTCTWQ